MEKTNNAKLLYVTGFLIIFYLAGIIWIALPYTTPVLVSLVSVNILVSFVILMYFHRKWDLQFILTALIIIFVGFITEMVGVNTGVIFGPYSYGAALGLKILNTPILTGLNWLMLLYCCYLIALTVSKNVILLALTGSFLMLTYDLMLEPVAMQLDMWTWDREGIPLQNYIAWFLLSFLLLFFLGSRKLKISNPIAIRLFLIQIVFLLILNIIRINP